MRLDGLLFRVVLVCFLWPVGKVAGGAGVAGLQKFQPPHLNDPLCESVKNSSTVTINAGRGIGSGSVVDPSGLVLTNHHVVAESGGSVQVVFLDGRKYPGQVVSDDERADQALIKMQASEQFQAVNFASSSPSEGTAVVAIGSPKGRPGVVTQGKFGKPMRQTDVTHSATLDHGNSGGPLLLQGSCEFVALNKGILNQGGRGQYPYIATSVEVVNQFIQQYLAGSR